MKRFDRGVRLLACCTALGAALTGTRAADDPLPAPQAAAAADNDKVELGSRFESQSAGISFCPPATMRQVQSSKLAEWTDAKFNWRLTIDRSVQKQPVPLVSGVDNFGKPIPGLLETTVDQLKASFPACTILRQDVTNTGEGGIPDPHNSTIKLPNVAMICMRYGSSGKHYLAQQAIIQADSQLYYLLSLTVPSDHALAADGPDDPQERIAVETFAAMLDTVRLLDRSGIRENQDRRLLATNGLLINFTPRRMHQALIKEQWQRVLKDGKDVGYVYITEETAADIPRKLTPEEMREGKNIHDLVKPGDGILIGMRSRLIENTIRTDKTKGEVQTDSVVWYYVSADRLHEDWTRLVVSDDHISPEKNYLNELGTSDRHIRPRVVMAPLAPGEVPAGLQRPEPMMQTRDDYKLDVVLRSNREAPEPVSRQLPGWYLPQAIGHLLPRLMPLKEARSYLFASYVSKKQEVMMRYVDVLPEQYVTFNHQTVRAIPIRDKLGIDGSPTFHYMTREGGYLGSESKEEKIEVIPTDAATLGNIWKNANLSRPEGIDKMPAATPGATIGAPPSTLSPAR